MFSKKVREFKDTKLEGEILLKRSEVLLSDLNASVRSTLKENLRRQIKRTIRIKFELLDFGHKKKNQDPAICIIRSVNNRTPLDKTWIDEQGVADATVPFSVEWFEGFLLEQSEKLGIFFRLRK